KAVRISACGGIPVSVKQIIYEPLLINSHGNGLTHRIVLNDFTFKVHVCKKGPVGSAAGEGIVLVLEQGIAGVGHAVGAVDLAGLKGHGKGISVRNRQYRYIVKA